MAEGGCSGKGRDDNSRLELCFCIPVGMAVISSAAMRRAPMKRSWLSAGRQTIVLEIKQLPRSVHRAVIAVLRLRTTWWPIMNIPVRLMRLTPIRTAIRASPLRSRYRLACRMNCDLGPWYQPCRFDSRGGADRRRGHGVIVTTHHQGTRGWRHRGRNVCRQLRHLEADSGLQRGSPGLLMQALNSLVDLACPSPRTV